MEYKVKLELDLTEKDIFEEEEVIKAIQEYAKTSAQKLTMDAVDDKMIAIIENALDKLEQVVKTEIKQIVLSILGNHDE